MNSQEHSGTYRSTFKATALFGGVQLINIFVTLARAKIIALLLGSEGMGLNGLFLKTIQLINNITNLGLPQSAVRDIAQAHATGNEKQVARIARIFRKLIWFTALLGLAVAILLGRQLSRWVFGSDEYTISFMFLGIIFVFGALTAGTFTLLRGIGRLKFLATSTVLGSVLGLAVSVPFYYYLGLKGIVPAIIASSFLGVLIARYFERKITLQPYKVSLKEAFRQGREMVSLGMVLSVTAFMTTGTSFLLSAFIIRTGSLEDLGFYSAGFSLIAGYTGMIFSAMTTDYFPRVSGAVAKSESLWRQLVNEQTHLVVLILTPLLLLIITLLPWIIRLLLTSEFLVLESFVAFFALGVLLQGPTWAMGIIIVAKNDLKIKFLSELAGNLLYLLFCTAGYYYWGLWGIGLGFLLSKSFGFLMTLIISKVAYQFVLSGYQLRMLVISFVVCSLLVFTQLKYGYPTAHIVGGILFVISACYSLIELNHKVGLKNMVSGLLKKK